MATSTWLYPLFPLPCLGHVHVAVSTLVPTVPWPRTFSCQTPRLLPDGMPLASRYAPCQTPRPYNFPLLDVRSTDMSRRVTCHTWSVWRRHTWKVSTYLTYPVTYSERMTSKIRVALDGVAILHVTILRASWPHFEFLSCRYTHAFNSLLVVTSNKSRCYGHEFFTSHYAHAFISQLVRVPCSTCPTPSVDNLSFAHAWLA